MKTFVRVLREVTKDNIPILLAFWPVFFVAAKGEYSNMHLLPRLEYEPKFGVIMGRLFFVNSLSCQIVTVHSLPLAKRLFAGCNSRPLVREVTKNNLPILLAFWPVFFVAAIGEYSNMHRLPRLEYEPKFGATMGILFFVTSLNALK